MAGHHDLLPSNDLLPSTKHKYPKLVQKRKSSRSPKCDKQRLRCKSSSGGGCGGSDGEEENEIDDKVEIEKRIMTLQKLVPGGESLEVGKLFEETAGYILALQSQVKTMKVLTSIFEGLEKENRKLGGQ